MLAIFIFDVGSADLKNMRAVISDKTNPINKNKGIKIKLSFKIYIKELAGC